jgi:molybdopterin converting factor small subunit
MTITVRYLAQLRRAAGVGTETLTLPGPCTVRELARRLASEREGLRPMLLDAAGAIKRAILVFVNDEQTDAERTLEDGDGVTLLSPIAGG